MQQQSKSNNQIVVLGAEAASHAIIDAGAKGLFGYPGTPSTEVFEGAEALIKGMEDREGRIYHWAANEKVAYEMALGASYSGCRTAVTMKHVGLNVAMDVFVNSAITGAQGGLVVIVADDPSMHSSQNEQDSRILADFAHVICLEPATPQEVYDYTIQAFEISENLKVPVMVRLVTRLAHTRGVVTIQERKSPTSVGKPPKEEIQNWILVPSMARQQYKKLRGKLPQMLKVSGDYNQLSKGSKKIGVVTAGMGRAYFDQLCREEDDAKTFSRLNVRSYPIDKKMLRDFAGSCDEVFVLEEDYPYIEDMLVDLVVKTHGRRDGTIPMEGELTPLAVRSILGYSVPETKASISTLASDLAQRLPKLCDGCGHKDAFKSIKEAMINLGNDDPRIFGDIGCYTLGAYAPYESIHTCVEMGASEGMAMGAAFVGMTPSIGVLGDSTFFHSGLPTLVSMGQSKVNATLVVVDNSIVGMTGQQQPVATDIIPNIAKSVGFTDEQIHMLTPLPKQHEENVKTMEKVLTHEGPDIVIFKRECIQAMRKGLYKKEKK